LWYSLTAVLLAVPLARAAEPAPAAGVWSAPAPLSPEDSRKSIVVPEGFAVELVAAEPLVMDPVAFAWGPDMRLWVVEMADYNWLPINDKSPAKPKGRVVYLTDTDGDGKYDKRTVFLDSLDYPTGVLPWRKGVLVTAAPDILYAEDVTPDNANQKADKIEKLYTGFNEGNPQLRVNGLQWGLDNWIYCANGLSNGDVSSHKTGQSVDIRGRDIRIRPDTGEIEPASGASQFGRVRDDYGSWFGVDNSRLIIHYVLEDHYLRRNPHVAAPEPFIDLVTPRNPTCYPIGKKVERLHAPYMANRFTSACGIAVYRDTYLGDEMHGQVFICEPVHNLITRRKLTEDGVTFKADRVPGEVQKEFLASTDEWFRPVHLRTGPDGALYIADMYRAVIEHPQWLPEGFNKKVDWMQGSDKGRVYRVVKTGVNPRKCEPFHKLNGSALAGRIDSPNGTQRDIAQAMLIELDRDVVKTAAAASLRTLAGDRSRSPAVRIQALSALHGVGQFATVDAASAVASRDPMLARFALRLLDDQPGERTPDAFLLAATTPALRVPAVEMQMALSLGRFSDEAAGRLLVGLLDRNRNDRYVAAAVMAASTGHIGALVDAMLRWKELPPPIVSALAATALAAQDNSLLADMLVAAGTRVEDGYTVRNYQLLAALLDALDHRGLTLRKLHEKGDDAMKAAVESADAVVQMALPLVQTGAKREARVYAVQLVGRGFKDAENPASKLMAVLESSQGDDVQDEIAMAIVRAGGDRWMASLTRWDRLTPAARFVLLNGALRRESLTLGLLDQIERKKIAIRELDASQRQYLLQHKNEAIRHRTAALLASISDRAKLVESYGDALKLTGDLQRGKELFGKTCAVCHRISGEGRGFGPDLGALSDRSPATLLEAVLDPNRSVDSRYLNYVAETKEGETITGILISETASGITLAGADGIKRTVLRKDLESLRSSGLSLMPEGLEQALGRQGMADVLLYVITQGQPARLLAGMKAVETKPDATGSFVMPVTSGAAFGTTIVYEKEDNNIGSWTRREDYVVWKIEGAKAGKYEVWLDYAADDKWKGNFFSIDFEYASGDIFNLREPVPTTGTQDDYKQTKVGVVTLTTGAIRVVMRPGAPITGELMDLRGVRLSPVKE
jgi:putative membrane-bound dehydrogenase-like protein